MKTDSVNPDRTGEPQFKKAFAAIPHPRKVFTKRVFMNGQFYSPLVSADDFIEGLRESLQFPEALRHAVQVLIKLPKAGEII